jgi:TRAP-type C4-dicarboxylate transport system permease small subunit
MSRKRLFSVLVMAVFVLFAFVPSMTSAQRFLEDIRGGVNRTATPAGLNQTTSLETMIGNVINVAISLIGVLLLGYIIYGGFLWITSNGDSKKTEQAIKMIRNAVIGMIIIVAAWAITDFVLARLGDIAGNGSTSGTTVNTEPTE